MTTLEKYRCGECGHDSYELWRSNEQQGLILKCKKCYSTALFHTLEPEYDIKHLEGDGTPSIY